MKRYLPLIIIAVVLIVALGGLWWLLQSSRSNLSTSSNNVGANTPPGAKPPHLRGDPNAPITLEEFGDFQCPSCGLFYGELKKTEQEFGPRLQVIFREYPLQTKHPNAVAAAHAAEAAGMQNRFWEMHDKLYETQKTWEETKDAKATFVDFAKQLGLDSARFTRDFDSAAVDDRITQDGIRAHALGVNGTPTVFVNGNLVNYELYTQDGLRDVINKALSGTRK
jgi:protein-disulfide isomerase